MILSDLGRGKEASRVFKTAVNSLERLVGEHPEFAEARSLLAANLGNLARLLRKLDRSDEAEHFERQAMNIREALAKEFPKVVDYRWDLSSSWTSRGFRLQELGRPRESLTASARLGNPSSSRCRPARQRRTEDRPGGVLQQPGEPARRLEPRCQAIDDYASRRSRSRRNSSPNSRRSSTVASLARADTISASSSPNCAGSRGRRSRSLLREPSRTFAREQPANLAYRADSAASYYNLGVWLGELGRLRRSDQGLGKVAGILYAHRPRQTERRRRPKPAGSLPPQYRRQPNQTQASRRRDRPRSAKPPTTKKGRSISRRKTPRF